MIKTADITNDGVYRYQLTRRWDDGPNACWVMLNPSTADAEKDDATIRLCLGHTRRWGGYGGIVVVNLYALRATDPKQLLTHPDPIGPDNYRWVRAAIAHNRTGKVIAAWGASKRPPGWQRGQNTHIITHVEQACRDTGQSLYCLGTTADGSPRHLRGVPVTQRLQSWGGGNDLA